MSRSITRPFIVHAALLQGVAMLFLAAFTPVSAQWTGGAADNIYNNTANWTGGTINGQFTTVAPGASLLFNADITTNINFNTGTTLTTALSGSGGTRITLDGDLKGTSGTTNVTLANSLILDLNGAMRAVGDTAGGGSWTIGANIVGSGGLTFTGGTNTSKLTITGTVDNTYSGGTVVNNGILSVESAYAVSRNLLGTGTMTVASGATLQLDQSRSTFTGTTFISGAGEVGTNGALVGARGFADSTYAAPIVLNANATIGVQQTFANNLFVLTGSVNLGANTLTLNPATGVINNGLRFTGVISGTGSIVQSNSGFSRLQGASTYTGATTVTAGTLQAGVATVGGITPTSGAFGVNSAVTAGTGAAIDLNGFNQTFGSLAGGGTITGKIGSGTEAPTLIVGTDNSSTTFSGVIQNGALTGTGLSLQKVGTGTQILSGANTYTGLTTVNGGTLTLQGDQSSATGGFSVSTFSAGGSPTATLNFASGATINTSAGKSISVARVGTIAAALNSAATVTNAGSLSLQRGADLNITGGTWTQSGSLTVGGNGGFRGAMSVSAGTFIYSGSSASVGYDGSATGFIAISGTGEVRFQGTGNVSVGRGAVSANTNVAGEILVNSGGTLTTQQKFVQNVEEGQISLAGGTVKLSADLVDFSDNLALVLSTATATKFDTNGFSTAIDDVISGSGAGGLLKQGLGNLKLAGANSYSGPTAITGGQLTANHATALGTGAVTISSGVSLKVGDGAAGQQLVFGSTMINDGSILMDLFNTTGGSGVDAAASDYLTFGAAFSGDLGQITLTNLAGSDAFALGARFYLVDWTSVTTALVDRSVTLSYDGSFAGLGSAYKFDESSFLSGGYITVAAVPEPGRLVLLALGGGLVVLRRRRTFRQRVAGAAAV